MAAAASTPPTQAVAEVESGTVLEAARLEICEEVGRFLHLSLEGDHRPAESVWGWRPAILGAPPRLRRHVDPSRVSVKFAPCKALVKRGAECGDSVFIGLPSREDVFLALRAGDLAPSKDDGTEEPPQGCSGLGATAVLRIWLRYLNPRLVDLIDFEAESSAATLQFVTAGGEGGFSSARPSWMHRERVPVDGGWGCVDGRPHGPHGACGGDFGKLSHDFDQLCAGPSREEAPAHCGHGGAWLGWMSGPYQKLEGVDGWHYGPNDPCCAEADHSGGGDARGQAKEGHCARASLGWRRVGQFVRGRRWRALPKQCSEEIYQTIEKLMMEDLLSRTRAPGMPRPKLCAAEARARACLMILQFDQLAIDRGSWTLASEASLELPPPFHSFCDRSLGAAS